MTYEREEIALKVREFIESLNNECKAGAIVIVEGRKDGIALREIGFKGEILVYNNFKGIINFVDHVSRKGRKVILLLDRDRKGRSLTSKILKKLEILCPHDSLYYKKKFVKITHGKIMCIENLSNFCLPFVEN
ncbi:MAG TPA: toprim domain-containing protein [Nitrososphaeraceae archaeon]|jgi:5S rRNA maturation endonuclease (ribonuclease M5)|nr:toprim domain-containing protein [Nitrososphaeraceae archaeon]